MPKAISDHQQQGRFERLLRSNGGRILFAVVCVLLFAGANTLEFRGLFATSRYADLFDWRSFWLGQSVRWSLWALVGLLAIVPLLRWGTRLPVIAQAAAHVGLALCAAWAVGSAWTTIQPDLPRSFDFEQMMNLRQEQRAADAESRSDARDQEPGARPPDQRNPDQRRTGTRRQEDWRPRGERGRGPMGLDRRRGMGAMGDSDGLLDRLLTHVFLLLLCGAGGSYLRSQETHRRAAQLSLERASLAAELGDARLAALESQLRPHFLFNALHSVGALVGAERNDEARTALVTLGDLLRVTLDRSSDGHSTLGQESALCESYLKLEQLRYGDRIRAQVSIPSDLAPLQVPPLLLLPLVENCIRHAVGASSSPVEISLRATSESGNLILDVTCSAGSFPAEVLAQGQGEGIGLANTRARLSATYGDQARMVIQNLDQGGTQVRLRLPQSNSV